MNIWHPFTQELTAKNPIKIVKGQGSYLYDSEGNKYLDLISSWWTNIHGHSQPDIAKAIYDQALNLEHVIFAGFTHDPAEKLCNKLIKYMPKNLEKFFFSDNGSTAVEIALKMAYQFFKNKDDSDRNIYINFSGAYHGDTLGAMSAAGIQSEYHSTFSEFFFKVFSINTPEIYRNCCDIDEKENQALNDLKKFLEDNSSHVCALVVEPLVQGAAGMKMHRSSFLDKVVDVVKSYGILVIFDEVMTGFFRTGTMFATHQTNSQPDFLCISKGITGGFLPLALTITTNKIYEAFLSNDWKKAFIHGHTYTANPIACAAACKSLELFDNKDTLENINQIEEVHKRYASYFKKFRFCGTISAFEVDNPIKLKEDLMKSGIIIRPINNNVYMLPPYCTPIEEIEKTYEMIIRIVN